MLVCQFCRVAGRGTLPTFHGESYELRCHVFVKTNDFVCMDGEWTTPSCSPFRVREGDCSIRGRCVRATDWKDRVV